MELVGICAPILVMAMLTGCSGVPLAYGLLAVRDLWTRLSVNGHPRARIIISAAVLLWLSIVVLVAYLLLSPGWQQALRM